MAQIIADIAEMRELSENERLSRRRIAVVPTMGALHEGHTALIREAHRRCEVVITTVFVNPTQFGRGEDFDRYPRDLERDARLASKAGSAYIFAPSAAAMYPQGYSTFVTVDKIADGLEGSIRPGHFRGVATVVVKLMNIVWPHVAVFGQKDAQQVVVIRQLLRDLDFGVELIVMPTVREADGLAMSSRNAYLTPEQRSQAPVLYQALRYGEQMIKSGERSREVITSGIISLIREKTTAGIDYVSVADAGTLEEQEKIRDGQLLLVSLAVRFGTTRLIDNIIVQTGLHEA